MTRPSIFIDTSYIYAIVNANDQWHSKAVESQNSIGRETRLVTTELVLVEIADGLSAIKFRREAVRVVEMIEPNEYVEVARLEAELYRRGFELYRSRPDKNWGLTDCVSFVAMRDRGIHNALTADEHFKQAGFRALLIDTL